jgi:tRNA threonylcarbamoyladenosine biosynthesis protein TsaE
MQKENVMSIQVRTSDEMQTLGARIATGLQDGDVVLLTGQMGNGKSELARGIAGALGVRGPVPSPSFTILNLYEEGSMPLYHFDWYRINGREELIESGLDEYIGKEGVTLIEWHEKAEDLLPETNLEIIITQLSSGAREVSFVPHGGFDHLCIDASMPSVDEEAPSC